MQASMFVIDNHKNDSPQIQVMGSNEFRKTLYKRPLGTLKGCIKDWLETSNQNKKQSLSLTFWSFIAQTL